MPSCGTNDGDPVDALDLVAVAHQRRGGRRCAKHFSDDEAMELTWDVLRNAANKIMVSLGVDAALVDEGVELFRVDAGGQTVSV